MYITVDMGGTKTRIASSNDLKNVLKTKRFYTNKNPITQRQIISEGIKELSVGSDVQKICMGIPGTIDRQNSKFISLPNYKELNGKPFSWLIDSSFLPKSFVENDGTLAAIGEAVLGAGKKYKKVGYLTFGTGAGGALVTKDDAGNFEYLSDEPGHTIIVEEGRISPSCGHSGCLEAYTSGRSFEALFGSKPQNTSDKEVWKKYAGFLNLGFEKIHKKWGNEVFVIGGSMTLEYDLFCEFLKSPVPVERSLTMDDAGIYGGFVLLQKLVTPDLHS